MALNTKVVNGETWYRDGDQRISKAEYEAKLAAQEAEGKAIRKRFRVSLDGHLTDITEEVSGSGDK